MIKPLVSIILPTYNRPTIIKEAIGALYKQSYKNFELILINDGSSLNYDESFLKKQKNIIYIKNKKSIGPAACRNLGVKNCTGEILLFMDDDIILHKDYLKIILSDLIKNKDIGAVCGRLFYPNKPNRGINENDKLKPIYEVKPSGDILLRSSLDTYGATESETLHAISVVPKKIFFDVGGFDERYIGNYTYVEPDFFKRIKNKGYKLIFDSKATADHLQIQEGGCRKMPHWRYSFYTIYNFIIFSMKFNKFKTIYKLPIFIWERLK